MADISYNPRYANYARFHGRSPAHQLEHDKTATPGACMMEFVLWNRARLVEASKEVPAAFYCGSLVDHVAYNAWLTAYVDKALSVRAAAPEMLCALKIAEEQYENFAGAGKDDGTLGVIRSAIAKAEGRANG